MSVLEVLRLLVGVPAVLLLPGWAWSYALLRPMDVLDRLAVAFGLSLALVPVAAIAWSRWLGLPLSTWGGVAIVAVLTACGAGLAWSRRRARAP